jgi:periodic tryptophan protein 1
LRESGKELKEKSGDGVVGVVSDDEEGSGDDDDAE